jgi:hypothetical protein
LKELKKIPYVSVDGIKIIQDRVQWGDNGDRVNDPWSSVKGRELRAASDKQVLRKLSALQIHVA